MAYDELGFINLDPSLVTDEQLKKLQEPASNNANNGDNNSGDGNPAKGDPAKTTKYFYASDGTPFETQSALAQYEATLKSIAATKDAAAQAKAQSDAALAQAKADSAAAQAAQAAQLQNERVSAYTLLKNEFSKYGLDALVPDLQTLISEGYSPSEFSLALQNTDAYKKRFAANQDRINKGLRALTPAEYIGLEDQYQNIMRNYGLPSSYYTKDAMGTQAGFNKFIANDVSAAE